MTGEAEIRYHDMAYLREKMKAILLSQEKQNIQIIYEILTCFTINNVLNGLLQFLKDAFNK